MKNKQVAEFQQHCNEIADMLDMVRDRDEGLYRDLRNAIEVLSVRLSGDWKGCTVAFHTPIPDDASSLF